jgi:hypothetical protein
VNSSFKREKSSGQENVGQEDKKVIILNSLHFLVRHFSVIWDLRSLQRNRLVAMQIEVDPENWTVR